MSSARIGCVLVAAGTGSRLGLATPKAFVQVRGDAMLVHSLRTLRAAEVNPVVVVVPESHLAQARALSTIEFPGALIVVGGSSRAESVMRGLTALDEVGGVDTVLVHDAARPFMPLEVFERVIDAVSETGDGVIPGLALVDTVAAIDASGMVCDSPARESLRSVQTPQGFPFAALLDAHRRAPSGIEFTDDASVFAAAGRRVRVVAGDARGHKITHPEDLDAAHAPHRVGSGVDAHAFSADASAELWLAGLHWPGEPGLEGHSDGDVACHALVDALLGAAGLGDIGGMFGTDDPRFAGARGDVFVTEALRRVHEQGWTVRNATVEIVGNRPKLAPRRREAEARLAELLGAPVNLAATTTDGLGLTGEGRGVGAIATVLLDRRLES